MPTNFVTIGFKLIRATNFPADPLAKPLVSRRMRPFVVLLCRGALPPLEGLEIGCHSLSRGPGSCWWRPPTMLF